METKDQHPLDVTEKILYNFLVQTLFLPTNQKGITTYLHTCPRIQIARFTSAPTNTRAACRRNSKSHILRAIKFGDTITADHKILNEEGESPNTQRSAFVVQDLATQWFQSYPCKTKAFTSDDEKLTKVS